MGFPFSVGAAPSGEVARCDAQVLTHDFVVGELACGTLHPREEILSLLEALPSAPLLGQREILYFIEQNDLAGLGIGFIDVHLLGAARFVGAPLWTSDTRLGHAAEKLHLAYSAEH